MVKKEEWELTRSQEGVSRARSDQPDWVTENVVRPDTLKRGKTYYLWNAGKRVGPGNLMRVELLSYLPDPGLILVKEEGIHRTVYRRNLYCFKT